MNVDREPFAARVDRARKTPRQRFRSRRQAFEQHLPLSSILWDFDIQQACSIAAEDRPALVIIEPRCTLDKADRVDLAHIGRLVGTHQHVVGAILLHEIFELMVGEDDRVEIEPL